MKKIIIGGISIVIGIVVAFMAPPEGLDSQAMIVLGTVIVANVFWITDIIPNFATGLLMLSSWVIFNIVDFQEAFGVFSTKGWWIVIGGLGIGAVATKTGLMKRMALYTMRLFPVNFRGQTLALMVAGTLVAPTIPSTNAKGAISAPLAQNISNTLGYKPQSKGSAGLFMATVWGFLVTGSIFLSATSTNYVIHGLLPEAMQQELSWGMWFLVAIPWAIIIMVGGYILINLVFKPKQETKVSKETIEKQIKDLGPMTKDERITGIVLIVTLIFWILERNLHIDSAVVAIVALSILVGAKVITPLEFRSKIAWDPAIFIGCAMSLGTILKTVGINEWLQNMMGDLITPLLANPILTIIVLAIVIYLAKFVLVSLITAATVFLVILVPFFSSLGYNPIILVFIVATSINIWFLPYMNPPYLTTNAAVDGKMANNKQAMISSVIYMGLNLLALLVSIPYWSLIGLM